MNETAIVQTLTAEVRVLMVGNRQITTTIFSQLDAIHHVDLEAFGRVSVKLPRGEIEGVWIVGRDKRSGALARSFVSIGQWRPDPQLDALRVARELPLIILAGLR